ncbi:sigma-70 family RNA polymerase sigma factor [soil metagenome]
MDRDTEQVLDEYLVVLACSGSRPALGALVTRWSPRLLRHASRSLANAEAARDAVQEAWMSAVRNLSRLEDPGRFGPWIYEITTRKCLDAMRRAVRGRRLAARAENELAANGASHSSPDGVGLDLTVAIRRLPLEQRLAVSLHYGEDLAVEEVAAVLGVPAGTIKSRLHNARRTLRTYLEGDIP